MYYCTVLQTQFNKLISIQTLVELKKYVEKNPVALFVTVGYEPVNAAFLSSKRVTNKVTRNTYRTLESKPTNSVITKLRTTDFGSSQGEVS